MSEALPPLTPLDWALIGGLAVSVVLGLWRGLAFEVISLLGWLFAWWMAQAFGTALAEWLPWGQPGSLLRGGSGYGLVFMGSLLLCAVGARMGRAVVSWTGLGWFDRLLGGCFGLTRGLVMLLAATAMLMWTPVTRAQDWQASVVAQKLESWVTELRPFFPEWPGIKPWAPSL